MTGKALAERTIKEQIREAFDTSDVAVKNIILRRAADALDAKDAEIARLRKALDDIAEASGGSCPFDGPADGQPEPEVPCPVCGDLGTWDDANLSKPSACLSASAASRARAALSREAR